MKLLQEIITSRIFLLALLLSFSSFAKTIGRVTEVKGSAFLMKKDGSTVSLKVGDEVNDFSEILTDDTSRLSYVDYFEHVVHLGGGSQVTIMNKLIELKNGKVWVQSSNDLNGFSIQTSNAVSSYADGEFIVTYDSVKLSTQLMVISGEVKFANILEDHLAYEVTSGNFTFIDQNYEKGFPRSPTLIGYDSYNSLVSMFNGVKPTNGSLKSVLAKDKLNKEIGSSVKRNIASVKPEKDLSWNDVNTKGARGKTIILRNMKQLRLPASAEASSFNYYQKVSKKIAAEKAKRVFKGDTVKVRVFGPVDAPQVSSFKGEKVRVFSVKKITPDVKKTRLPSSIKKEEPIKIKKTKIKIRKDNEFQKSLMKEYVKQKRHDNEVNDLIDELKSFSNRYKKNY